MEQKSTLEDLFAENKQLRKELDNALKALGLARDRLIEAQDELRRIKWYLVSLEEAKGA
jgi:peptidoglycan hydrolase CwlO-like protein